jgi:stage V sporulation protein SpoVS
MRRLLEPSRPGALALLLLALAAASVLVAGFQHARLFHRGYAEVQVVGPLFFMNAIGSMVVVLALLAERVWIFVLGALSICVPSLFSIAISRASSSPGWAARSRGSGSGSATRRPSASPRRARHR